MPPSKNTYINIYFIHTNTEQTNKKVVGTGELLRQGRLEGTKSQKKGTLRDMSPTFGSTCPSDAFAGLTMEET